MTQNATGIDTDSAIIRDVLSPPLPSALPEEDPLCPNTKEKPIQYRFNKSDLLRAVDGEKYQDHRIRIGCRNN